MAELNELLFNSDSDGENFMGFNSFGGNIERASTSRSLVRIPIYNESLYHDTQKKTNAYSTSISMVTQHQSQCQQHRPLSEPALTVINIEGMSAAKQQLLAEV